LSDLSLVQNASLNAIQASNIIGQLTTGSVGEIASLSQVSAENDAPAQADTQGTLIGSNVKRRTLNKGPLLVAPETDIVVETPHGSINIAAKSLALIVASDTGVAVYNLHDVRKSAVTVTHKNGHTFNVTPGTSAVVSGSDRAFEDVNPAQFVRYRQPIAKSLGNSVKLYRAEFEIMSLLNGLPAFKELMASENKSTRKTMLQTLKTAAILMQLSGNAEPFKFFSKPEVTAMTKGQ
jgi:hypothetical protein